MNAEIRRALDKIDARTGTMSTEEQMEFASDFTKPLVSFSDPGTGKSHSIVKGLILAETYHQIPGTKINAMSFTREATAELSGRYQKACKQCGIHPHVKFNTFHSICGNILKDCYPSVKFRTDYDYSETGDLGSLSKYLEAADYKVDDFMRVRKILKAIENLNHAMVYDDRHVELSYRFKELDMPLDIFQKVRANFFNNQLQLLNIAQGDIPMFALYVLATRPHIQQKYKEQYKIMVVDEFQDMTKLYLIILSMISENLVVIGDIKQQIYGFNGACSEIVQEYRKLYPNARQVNLTKSFRCRDEIAAYATSIYHPNDPSVQIFSGVGEGGEIKTLSTAEMNIKEIVDRVKAQELDETRSRESMFLFRNRFSITPIAEYLYQRGVSFRIKDFKMVMDFPIYNAYCAMAELASDPTSEVSFAKIPNIFPEFSRFNMYSCPLYKTWKTLCKREGKNLSILDVPYNFKEKSSVEIINALKRAEVMIKQNKTAAEVFSCFEDVYDKYIIQGKWWTLEMSKEEYASLVEPIITQKTFSQMISEEYDKASKVEEAYRVCSGVKCYTMHMAKGLEADDVYILDAEDGFFPSKKNFKKLITSGCEYEAAKVIREERNLLYVAVTRAKDNVFISYTNELTPLIRKPNNNKYSYLDEIFNATNQDFDDLGAYARLFGMESKIAAALVDRYPVVEQADKVSESMEISDLEDEEIVMHDLAKVTPEVEQPKATTTIQSCITETDLQSELADIDAL